MSKKSNEDLTESKLENPKCENNTRTVLHMPTSKFKNTIFSVYLFEIEKLRDRKCRKLDLAESKIGPYGVS